MQLVQPTLHADEKKMLASIYTCFLLLVVVCLGQAAILDSYGKCRNMAEHSILTIIFSPTDELSRKTLAKRQTDDGDQYAHPCILRCRDGRDGRDGVPGPRGLTGRDGKTGDTGPQGPPGLKSGGVTYVRWG